MPVNVLIKQNRKLSSRKNSWIRMVIKIACKENWFITDLRLVQGHPKYVIGMDRDMPFLRAKDTAPNSAFLCWVAHASSYFQQNLAGSRLAFSDLFWPQSTIEIHFFDINHELTYELTCACMYISKYIQKESQEMIHSPYGMYSETFYFRLCCLICENAMATHYIDCNLQIGYSPQSGLD